MARDGRSQVKLGPSPLPSEPPMTRLRLFAILLAALPLAGCGAAAAPCRIGSAVLDIIPIVGHAAATPTDACATVIDP